MSGTGRRPLVNPLLAGFAAGVVIALVVGLMATINLQYGAPWAANHTLTAAVLDADSMAVGSDVRIAGRLVGQVTSVTAEQGYTDVTFHVNSSDWPLPNDTTAQVRLATLLGQKYIQLTPGHSSQTFDDGATIGLKATTPVVDFDQILDTFDRPTRTALVTFLKTVSASVQGQEGNVQQLIPDLSDLSVHSQVPTQELVSRDPEVNSILINLGITADQLDQSRDDLAGVIDNMNQLTATLATNNGTALKTFIVNSDLINQTTDAILGNGNAQTFSNGLSELGTFATDLTTLVADTQPQTATFFHPVGSSTNPSSVPPGATVPQEHNTPAQSAIDLIYEIGSATSQADGSFNYFLRQNAQTLDVSGLTSTGGITPPLPIAPQLGAKPPVIQLPKLPLPLPSPACIPGITQCGGSGGPGGGGGAPGGGTTCIAVICIASFSTSDDVSIADLAVQPTGAFPARWR
ncbi:MAG: MCE family protein [Candidatus Dormibacteraeota bacterium]|nr:MCE family protein [Candidatus Dormibacteraeota bacterium]